MDQFSVGANSLLQVKGWMRFEAHVAEDAGSRRGANRKSKETVDRVPALDDARELPTQ